MFSGIWAAPASGGLPKHSDTASEMTQGRDVINSICHIWDPLMTKEHLASCAVLTLRRVSSFFSKVKVRLF